MKTQTRKTRCRLYHPFHNSLEGIESRKDGSQSIPEKKPSTSSQKFRGPSIPHTNSVNSVYSLKTKPSNIYFLNPKNLNILNIVDVMQ